MMPYFFLGSRGVGHFNISWTFGAIFRVKRIGEVNNTSPIPPKKFEP